MPTGKPVSQTGAQRLTEAEQHAQGHMVSDSGARLEERTQSSGSFHCTWWLPYQCIGTKSGEARNKQGTAALRSRR